MEHDDLPERWLRELDRYTDEKYGPDYKWRGRLGARDFGNSKTLKVTFLDGSVAVFRYAFVLELEHSHRDEVMLFTEHCGYHLLLKSGVTIEFIEDDDSHVVRLIERSVSKHIPKGC